MVIASIFRLSAATWDDWQLCGLRLDHSTEQEGRLDVCVCFLGVCQRGQEADVGTWVIWYIGNLSPSITWWNLSHQAKDRPRLSHSQRVNQRDKQRGRESQFGQNTRQQHSLLHCRRFQDIKSKFIIKIKLKEIGTVSDHTRISYLLWKDWAICHSLRENQQHKTNNNTQNWEWALIFLFLMVLTVITTLMDG